MTLFTQDTARRQKDRLEFNKAEEHLLAAQHYFGTGEIDQDTLNEAQARYDQTRLRWWGWTDK